MRSVITRWGIWIIIVVAIVGWAVYRNVQTRTLVDALVGTDVAAQKAAAARLVEYESFYEILQQRTAKERLNAVKGLEAWDTATGTTTLVTFMKEPEPRVREAIIASVTRLAAKHMDEVVAGLASAETFVRNGSALALSAQGEAAVPKLVEQLKVPAAAAAASVALSRIGPIVTPQVLPLLKGKQDDATRIAAADLLGKLKDNRATPDLLRIAKTPATSAAAVSALASIADPRAKGELLAAIKSATFSSEVRSQAAVALGRIGGDDCIQALVATMNEDDLLLREGVVRGMAQAGAPGINALMSQIAHPDQSRHRLAIDALGTIRNGLSVPALTTLLRNPDAAVRGQAATALGVTRATSAVGPLVAALSDSNPSVGYNASLALGQLGAPGVSALIQALGSSNPTTAYLAARALGQIGAASVPALVNIAASSSSTAQLWALVGLSESANAEAAAALRNLQSAQKVDRSLQWLLDEAVMQL